jgi:DNA-binding NtrC family response regulator
MERKTILYISDQTTCSNAISDALNAAGYEVVTTNTTEAVALLYVLHSIAAVVVRAREQASLDVRSIRAMCPDVPIVILCRGRINCVPSQVDTVGTYVATGQSPATLAAAVRRLVAKKPATPCPRRPELSRKRGR